MSVRVRVFAEIADWKKATVITSFCPLNARSISECSNVKQLGGAMTRMALRNVGGVTWIQEMNRRYMKERVHQSERRKLWWTRELDDLKWQVRKSRKRCQKTRKERRHMDVILSRTIRLFVKLSTLTGTKLQADFPQNMRQYNNRATRSAGSRSN